jgi:hypothetical protein
VAFPEWFLRFIGVAEVLALGLVLPPALRIRQELLPLAAIGLAVIMVGAVGISIYAGPVATAANAARHRRRLDVDRLSTPRADSLVLSTSLNACF